MLDSSRLIGNQSMKNQKQHFWRKEQNSCSSTIHTVFERWTCNPHMRSKTWAFGEREYQWLKWQNHRKEGSSPLAEHYAFQSSMRRFRSDLSLEHPRTKFCQESPPSGGIFQTKLAQEPDPPTFLSKSRPQLQFGRRAVHFDAPKGELRFQLLNWITFCPEEITVLRSLSRSTWRHLLLQNEDVVQTCLWDIFEDVFVGFRWLFYDWLVSASFPVSKRLDTNQRDTLLLF